MNPGWYEDPREPAYVRWFNGTAFTPLRRQKNQVPAQPIDPSSTVQPWVSGESMRKSVPHLVSQPTTGLALAAGVGVLILAMVGFGVPGGKTAEPRQSVRPTVTTTMAISAATTASSDSEPASPFVESADYPGFWVVNPSEPCVDDYDRLIGVGVNGLSFACELGTVWASFDTGETVSTAMTPSPGNPGDDVKIGWAIAPDGQHVLYDFAVHVPVNGLEPAHVDRYRRLVDAATGTITDVTVGAESERIVNFARSDASDVWVGIVLDSENEYALQGFTSGGEAKWSVPSSSDCSIGGDAVSYQVRSGVLYDYRCNRRINPADGSISPLPSPESCTGRLTSLPVGFVCGNSNEVSFFDATGAMLTTVPGQLVTTAGQYTLVATDTAIVAYDPAGSPLGWSIPVDIVGSLGDVYGFEDGRLFLQNLSYQWVSIDPATGAELAVSDESPLDVNESAGRYWLMCEYFQQAVCVSSVVH